MGHTYAHAIREEEMDLSFADSRSATTPNGSIRLRVHRRKANKKKPPTELARGVHFIWSTRPGSKKDPNPWTFCDLYSNDRRRAAGWQEG